MREIFHGTKPLIWKRIIEFKNSSVNTTIIGEVRVIIIRGTALWVDFYHY